MDTKQQASLIGDALDSWSPVYPRRVTRNQLWAGNDGEAIRALLDSQEDPADSPFISVYSFPRGHTKGDNIPDVDTLFIDFDFEGGDYEPGSGDRDAWRRDISHLLVRARHVAQIIRDGERTDAWRASLSGHKGIHLFLDFPVLHPELGSFDQYIAGLNQYATDLVSELAGATGLDDLDRYVDVTSSDLGRLCRVPNTLHGGAADSFGEERYCVPVTIDELSTLTPEAYEEFTSAPRDVADVDRVPSETVGEIISNYVQNARGSSTSYSSSGGSVTSWDRVDEYREESNDDLTLRDSKFLTSDMPCVWNFHEREDKYDYGNQSYVMETHCIGKLLESNFPIEVIKEFLSTSPDYDESYTEQKIKELIAFDFNPYRTEKLLRQAPEFCNPEKCMRCKQAVERDEELQRLYNNT